MNFEDFRRAVQDEWSCGKSSYKFKVVRASDETNGNTFVVLASPNGLGLAANLPSDLDTGRATHPTKAWGGNVKYVDHISSSIVVENSGSATLVPDDTIFITPFDFLGALASWCQMLHETGQPALLSTMQALMQRNQGEPMPALPGLEESQELAMQRAGNPFLILWGPPGTGKTYTLGRILAQHWAQGRTVSAIANSHNAVDELALATNAAMEEMGWRPEQGVLLRYRQNRQKNVVQLPKHLTAMTPEAERCVAEIVELRKERRVLEASLGLEPNDAAVEKTSLRIAEIIDQIKVLQNRIDEIENSLATQARILVSTVYAYVSKPVLNQRRYEVGVVDEASALSMPFIVRHAYEPRDFLIYAGDFRQFSPIPKSKNPKTMEFFGKSVFDFLNLESDSVLKQMESEGKLAALLEQRRMRPEIGEYISENFYFNRLKTIGVHKFAPAILGWPDEAFVIADADQAVYPGTSPKPYKAATSGWIWDRSAQMVRTIAQAALQLGPTITVAVATPFKAQSIIFGRLLAPEMQTERLLIGTIHSLQGKEADVVVLDPVNLASPYWSFAGHKLANVAISRARKQVIVVGSRHRTRAFPLFYNIAFAPMPLEFL